MLLLVGLGNPGGEYEETRHNIGFKVIDHLVAQMQPASVHNTAFKGELFKKDRLLLLKPSTYMNLSGESVQPVAHYFRCETLIVIHDDLDLSFGALKFKRGGGHGGHNGLKSIDSHCGPDYIRIRMGIGRPVEKSLVVRYVLQPFNPEEHAKIEPWIEKAAEAALHLIKGETLESVAARFSQKQI